VEGLVRTLGIERLSKSQVSAMAQELDPMVASFRNRPLDPVGYPYVWVDALTQRVREDGRIVNVCAVIATGVTAEGKREILGVDVSAPRMEPPGRLSCGAGWRGGSTGSRW
jgi:transposase-like protein